MPSVDPLGLVGTTVSEKYEIESVVGEGGFAIVYRARHTVFNRPVAIKVFKALGDLSSARRNELLADFVQEGRVLAELSERSAAICQARDIGTLRMGEGRTGDTREMPYMVLEWLEGRSLEQVLDAERSRPGRSAEQALRILEPAAEALALAHRKGIVHRDVKPANIFILGDVDGDFTVKLLDFGIAKVVQDVQAADSGFSRTKGLVSSFTPAYGAPEQYSRSVGSTGPWTDVFALALILVELMTRAAPLRGDDLTQLAFSAMDPRVRPTPRASGVPVSDALEAVFLRALAVAPGERFQSMGEFWEALRASLAMEPTILGSGNWVRPSSPGSGPTSAPRSPITGPEPPEVALPTLPRTSAGAYRSPAPPVAASGKRGAPTALYAGLGAIAVLGVGALVVRGAIGRGHGLPKAVASVPSASAAPPVTAPPPPLSCPDGMVKIEGGKFFMGSDDKTDEPNERPAHQVTLSPYCIDKTEVTVDAYRACSEKGECKRAPRENEWEGIDAAARKIYDPLCNTRDPARGNYPINCIDWELASAYCGAVGKRLPTEGEWEFATRGSDGRKYPWGDDPPTDGTYLNACGKECVAWGKKHPDQDNPLKAMYPVDDGWATTAPVGSFPKGASPFGLDDVVGNVWEWVSDWYAPYGAELATDPKGPASGTERVLRGGAWNGANVGWVRPTYRFKTTPTLRSHGIGMRCAKSLAASG